MLLFCLLWVLASCLQRARTMPVSKRGGGVCCTKGGFAVSMSGIPGIIHGALQFRLKQVRVWKRVSVASLFNTRCSSRAWGQPWNLAGIFSLIFERQSFSCLAVLTQNQGSDSPWYSEHIQSANDAAALDCGLLRAPVVYWGHLRSFSLWDGRVPTYTCFSFLRVSCCINTFAPYCWSLTVSVCMSLSTILKSLTD